MKRVLLSLFGILLLISSCKENSKKDNEYDPSQATLYFGGDIITMEGDEAQYAEAVVQQNGKITFVGTLKDAEKQFPKANKNDLQGKTLLPGFIDGHGHLYLTGFYNMMANLMPPPDGNCNSIQGVVDEMNTWKDSEKGSVLFKQIWMVGRLWV